jgi:Ser/Thr protein kinase RdoA (MazF antagonist)
MSIPSSVFSAFNLKSDQYSVEPIGSGHIHLTFKLSGNPSYILQRVNKNVFTKPEVIAANLKAAADFISEHHPEFLFPTVIKTNDSSEMTYDNNGYPWRLFPYIKNTKTIDQVETSDQAYKAANEFARLTRMLDGVDIHKFKPTIDRFHDLNWRWEQFEEAYKSATADRIKEAALCTQICKDYYWVVEEYKSLIDSGTLKLRIMHNDTKVNNVLFDATSGKTVCAIDLDTLMPGYFIYDIGDMIRTFVSPVNEEEKDLSKVVFRKDIYEALVSGYMEQMASVLGGDECEHVAFGGLMMTYIMAMRMLTDFLNGDIYYHTTYHGQNLVRASNQFRLLETLNSMLNSSK